MAHITTDELISEELAILTIESAALTDRKNLVDAEIARLQYVVDRDKRGVDKTGPAEEALYQTHRAGRWYPKAPRYVSPRLPQGACRHVRGRKHSELLAEEIVALQADLDAAYKAATRIAVEHARVVASKAAAESHND